MLTTMRDVWVLGSLFRKRVKQRGIESAVAFSLLALGCILTYSSYLACSSHTRQRTVAVGYGEQLDMHALQRALAAAGTTLPIEPNAYFLLYFFRPPHFNHLPAIKYSQVLLKRFHRDSLSVFAITDSGPGETSTLVESESLTLPILHDPHGTFRSLFRVPEPYEHTFLVTGNGNVKFSMAGVPPEDLIRQLVEKYILGKVDYTAGTASLGYRIGQSLKSLRAMAVADGSTTDLLLRDTKLILIPGSCTSCDLDALFHYYSTHSSSYDNTGRSIILFSKRFSRKDLLTKMKAVGMPFDNAYISDSSTAHFDDQYSTKRDENVYPILISVDSRGRVSLVSRFSSGD